MISIICSCTSSNNLNLLWLNVTTSVEYVKYKSFMFIISLSGGGNIFQWSERNRKLHFILLFLLISMIYNIKYISNCKCIRWSEGRVESDQRSQPLSVLSSCCSALPAVSRKTLCVTASLFRAWKMQLGSRSSSCRIVSGASCFLSARLWLLFGQRGGNSTTVRLLTAHWGQDAVFTEDFLT